MESKLKPFPQGTEGTFLWESKTWVKPSWPWGL